MVVKPMLTYAYMVRWSKMRQAITANKLNCVQRLTLSGGRGSTVPTVCKNTVRDPLVSTSFTSFNNGSGKGSPTQTGIKIK